MQLARGMNAAFVRNVPGDESVEHAAVIRIVPSSATTTSFAEGKLGYQLTVVSFFPPKTS
jgi:hypothetical protein